jgi:hypothetical protein
MDAIMNNRSLAEEGIRGLRLQIAVLGERKYFRRSMRHRCLLDQMAADRSASVALSRCDLPVKPRVCCGHAPHPDELQRAQLSVQSGAASNQSTCTYWPRVAQGVCLRYEYFTTVDTQTDTYAAVRNPRTVASPSR